MPVFQDLRKGDVEMKMQRAKLWILAVVCTFALLAPTTVLASWDQPAGPVSLWQTLGQIWQSWTGWWTAESEEGTATEEQTALQMEAAGSTDQGTGDEGSTIDVSPPTPDSFGLTEEDDPDPDGAPGLDPVG